MKLPSTPGGGRLLTGMIAIVGMPSQAFADPEIPRGTLDVDRTLIRVGAQSQLQWQIEYPSRITDQVDVIAPHVLKPRRDMKMRVRILGSSFADLKTNNGHGNNVDGIDSSNPGTSSGHGGEDTLGGIDDEKTGTVSTAAVTDYPVEVVWSKNNAAWSRIFYGPQSSVVPTAVVLNTKVAKGDTIDFGGRGFLTDWLPLYTTSSTTPNVLILKNGDSVPEFIAAYRMGLVKGYLKPYLSSDFKTLNLGVNDFVVIMELDESNPANSGFDLQDLAVLVTFE